MPWLSAWGARRRSESREDEGPCERWHDPEVELTRSRRRPESRHVSVQKGGDVAHTPEFRREAVRFCQFDQRGISAHSAAAEHRAGNAARLGTPGRGGRGGARGLHDRVRDDARPPRRDLCRAVRREAGGHCWRSESERPYRLEQTTPDVARHSRCRAAKRSRFRRDRRTTLTPRSSNQTPPSADHGLSDAYRAVWSGCA